MSALRTLQLSEVLAFLAHLRQSSLIPYFIHRLMAILHASRSLDLLLSGQVFVDIREYVQTVAAQDFMLRLEVFIRVGSAHVGLVHVPHIVFIAANLRVVHDDVARLPGTLLHFFVVSELLDFLISAVELVALLEELKHE